MEAAEHSLGAASTTQIFPWTLERSLDGFSAWVLILEFAKLEKAELNSYIPQNFDR